MMLKLRYFLVILIAIFLNIAFIYLHPVQVFATTNALSQASDTLSTSRPSASSPINDVGNGTLSSATSTVIYNNGSRFLASDSAKLVVNKSPWGFSQTGLSIASQSADLKTVYFSGQAGSLLPNGYGTLINAVTASHVISFKTVSTIPLQGKVVITFPSLSANDTQNAASPSATTFQFNGLASSGVTINSGSGMIWGLCTIAAPVITCPLVNGSTVPGNSTITVTIGTASATLINPTKSAVAGTADKWKIALQTQDSSNNTLDGPTNVVVGTVEAVTVDASIDSTMTFTISSATSSACGDPLTAGLTTPSSTNVDLGIITSSITNQAQLLTVTTNAANGYAITATSSGHLINAANGSYFPDANQGNSANGNSLSSNTAPAPQPIYAGQSAFGIHPCTAFPVGSGNASVNTIFSDSSTNQGQGGGLHNYYANPWNNNGNGFAMLLSSFSTQPTGIGAQQTWVEYGATAASSLPAGIYSTYYTYVATPTF